LPGSQLRRVVAVLGNPKFRDRVGRQQPSSGQFSQVRLSA
jgi:hypothetical protein